MSKPLDILGFCDVDGVDAKTATLQKLSALAENVDDVLAVRKSVGLVKRAVSAWQKGRISYAGQLALESINAYDQNALAYLLLAIVLEKMGYRYKALVTYEKAYEIDPENPDIIINLGQLATKFKMTEMAEKLTRIYISKKPDFPDGYCNLASLFNQQNRLDDAIETLRYAINKMPEEATLWNALGTILSEEGRIEEGIIYYNEALRLVPGQTRFYHNLAFAYLHLGEVDKAAEMYELALKQVVDPSERCETIFSHGVSQLQAGNLETGFQEYEIRTNKRFRGYIQYVLPSPLWQGEPLEGKTILAIGEQGLGDEIMFANILPDLIKDVGPNGKVILAVEKRLVALFRRSFPETIVECYDDRMASNSDGSHELRFFPFLDHVPTPNYHVMFGTLLGQYRKRHQDFPHQAYLKGDPAQTESFRRALRERCPTGPLVGICWRSMLLSMKRTKYYPTLDMWGPIFRVPGVHFVNLQYGGCENELAEAEAQFGIEILRPENHDLTADIDGNAALSAALDLVVSAPTAVAATSGAVGIETWFLLSCNSWPQLGTDHYPWYRKTRVFTPSKGLFGDWDEVLPRVGVALQDFVAQYAASHGDKALSGD